MIKFGTACREMPKIKSVQQPSATRHCIFLHTATPTTKLITFKFTHILTSMAALRENVVVIGMSVAVVILIR